MGTCNEFTGRTSFSCHCTPGHLPWSEAPRCPGPRAQDTRGIASQAARAGGGRGLALGRQAAYTARRRWPRYAGDQRQENLAAPVGDDQITAVPRQ